MHPRLSAAPGKAKYHISRSGAAPFTSMLAATLAAPHRLRKAEVATGSGAA
jgi:hypothetical protein